MGPGGQAGTALESSVTDLEPQRPALRKNHSRTRPNARTRTTSTGHDTTFSSLNRHEHEVLTTKRKSLGSCDRGECVMASDDSAPSSEDDRNTPVLYCMSCGTGIPKSACPEPGAGPVTFICPTCGQSSKISTARSKRERHICRTALPVDRSRGTGTVSDGESESGSAVPRSPWRPNCRSACGGSGHSVLMAATTTVGRYLTGFRGHRGLRCCAVLLLGVASLTGTMASVGGASTASNCTPTPPPTVTVPPGATIRQQGSNGGGSLVTAPPTSGTLRRIAGIVSRQAAAAGEHHPTDVVVVPSTRRAATALTGSIENEDAPGSTSSRRRDTSSVPRRALVLPG